MPGATLVVMQADTRAGMPEDTQVDMPEGMRRGCMQVPRLRPCCRRR